MLFGLEAIEVNNGWAISAVGITIVFSGLVMLSLLISQLHKVLDLIENPAKLTARFKTEKSKSDAPGETMPVLTCSQVQHFGQFALLARTMEDHFSLPRLLHLAQISGLKDPCGNLAMLLETRIIHPDGKGFFCWDAVRFEAVRGKD